MRHLGRLARTRLLAGVSAAVILSGAGVAHAQDRTAINIPPQPLASALYQFGGQTGLQVMFAPSLAERKSSAGVNGETDVRLAMAHLLEGTGLSFHREGDIFVITDASDPQSGSAAGDGADGTVQALIVTAQKKEEAIQDVPIAISAFTEKSLEEQKIEGGFDLLKAIPNVTFSKNNFTSYNFSIRGVGTKAISATTDPGVAVSFNNIALIQNRLFEQEYFDVERVEVLRGPQGTLYGRNATAGVINVISVKPNLKEFDGWIKGEVGNYHSKRISAMVNVPLVEDKLAIRVAGALTDRQGYDYNEITKNHINGRDLWSGRITLAFKPTDSIRSNLIWEHFEEDDNRSRTGKQLCHRDPGPTDVGGVPVGPGYFTLLRQAMFSQGCKPGSLYDNGAFDTPNGMAEPFVFASLALTYAGIGGTIGTYPDGSATGLLKYEDPFRGRQQSHDLRTIASIRDPKYQAKAEVLELNLDVDLTENLTLTSQTAYNKDQVYSFQDFNRFNTEPIFNDSSVFLNSSQTGPSDYTNMSPGGYFCDPQLGCSNRMVSFDISQAKSEQFSEEIRLQSSLDGPLNFSVGANYTRFHVLVDYYVFNNLLTEMALAPPFNDSFYTQRVDFGTCGLVYYSAHAQASLPSVPSDDPRAACPYIDTSSIDNLAGDGHNYFRSKNPYKLGSAAAFGEIYWQVRSDVKVTAGLRYTDDRKTFIPVPTQVLLSKGFRGGGTVNRGYPELVPIKQHWGEFTGRLGVDWKPDLSFTDETMLYAFYSRGYKGGGANPPSPGFATHDESFAQALEDPTLPPGFPAFVDSLGLGVFPTLTLTAREYGPTFRPEFVNAFEVGAKNTLLGGALTFNTDAFFYDYKDYQVSQIRDRTAVNENFDAQTWGLEFETRFAPSRHLQIIGNLGYLDTRIGNGMKSIDIMNRTQGNPDWMVVKPWMQYPSNCIAPVDVVKSWLLANSAMQSYWTMCGNVGGLLAAFNHPPIDPATNAPYNVASYPDANGGAGFYADLGGNELPNAPHWTANLGGQYSWDLASDWTATVRGDAYWQSQSWARVYNDNPYDKLHGWYNVNLSVWFERPDDDLKIELYAKNLLDKTPITDAFLNSDDTALTTNVFVLDPRLIGLSIKKGF